MPQRMSQSVSKYQSCLKDSQGYTGGVKRDFLEYLAMNKDDENNWGQRV